MKHRYHLLLIVLLLSLLGCEKISPDAVELSVDFSWEGMKPCGWGNPEIKVSGVPPNTKLLKIRMYDHAYSHDHGTVLMSYAGDGIIRKDRFKEIQGPCPVWTPGRYQITIKAIDEHEAVIGIGSKERVFPEEELK